MIRLLTAVGIIFLLSFLFISSQRGSHVRATTVQNSIMEDVRISHINQDRTDWSARVGTVVINPENDRADISDIRFFFPGQELTVDAPKGVYDLKTDFLSLDGSVLARNDKWTISTDHVKWLANERKLVTDAYVTIKGDSFVITGDGLDITDQGRMSIDGNVRSMIFPAGA